MLADLPALITAYYALEPDPQRTDHAVSFGTSGHRGSALHGSFNQAHVLAITEAICRYRKLSGIDGPLHLGIDTHALSRPAFATALEVLAAHEVAVRIAHDDGYTPTPVVSHAILVHNRGRTEHLADGIIISPSHNPPEDGGFKYNPPNGGPADVGVTKWIQDQANALLKEGVGGVMRRSYERALRAPTTERYDFRSAYVEDLSAVIDMEAIAGASVRIGADPLGGASVSYWPAIAERYGLDLTIVNDEVDATFRFMSLDWDGRIRMDPSSSYAMQRLIALREQFDVAFACDADADRHGIVTRSGGLMQPNHYLAVAIDYLFRNRPQWPRHARVGKTLVSSQMIDRVAARLGRELYEVPVGFKWFVDGLLDGSLGFGGEESAGASFVRRNGSVWTTDKDGMVPALLSAEITARTGRDPSLHYEEMTAVFGEPAYDRVEAPASAAQKARLSKLSPDQIRADELAGEPITAKLSQAPGNGGAVGGVKVVTESGWFAARPSGTEDIYKIYVESFRGREHLARIVEEAQAIVGEALR